jgi:lipooligosaccharide transport system ATP-binding protein
MHTQVLIDARALTKRFTNLTAVDAIDFEVVRGECFGLLGPNGAGKTSTIRMICCVSPVTSGRLSVLGMDPAHDARAIKARLGVVPQDDNLDTDLTVVENLLAYARYFDIRRPEATERAREAMRIMQLTEKSGEKIDNLSGGMKRRLTVARALVSSPELLVLDEPTTGLDPQARQLFWQKLRQLKREGMTMLLTTHYMEEAAQLCDRVIIMDESKIIARGTPQELIRSVIGREVVEVHFDGVSRDQAVATVRSVAGGFELEETEDVVFVYEPASAAGGRDGARVSEIDLEALEEVTGEVVLRKATLEDVFIKLVGREVRE